MAKSSIAELQRENAELRERLDQFRRSLDSVVEQRAMPNFIVSGLKPPMSNSMSLDEISSHLREMALHCIRMARECTDARVAQELEETSIVLADRASNLKSS
jgi:hypothetical protein